MYHGYPDETIPTSCEYKIGKHAVIAPIEAQLHNQEQRAEAAAQAREDALEKGIAVIKNRIDCIMISYEGEENEAITQRPYAMSDGMQECILMLESLRTEGGDE